MTSEQHNDKPEIETVEAEWTQADTPGSEVALEKLPNPADEATTEIATEAEAALAVDEPEATPTTDLSDVAAADAVTPASGYSPRRLYRDAQQADPVADEAADEAARLAAEEADREAAEAARAEAERLAIEKAARNRALGVVAPTGPEVVAPAPPQKLVTDRFFGAFGLFIFRLIIAGVLGIRAYQMLTDIAGQQAALGHTQLPEPATMAWVAAIGTAALALAFAFGAFVRVAGFGLLVTAALALVFVRWGAFSVFQDGQQGFVGELELVLAGAGLVFLCLGGGRWGIDGWFRSSRAKAKVNREA